MKSNVMYFYLSFTHHILFFSLPRITRHAYPDYVRAGQAESDRGHGAGPLSYQTWVTFHKNTARRKTNKYEAKYFLILHLLPSFVERRLCQMCVSQTDHLSINTSVKYFWAGHQTISLRMTDLMTPGNDQCYNMCTELPFI